VKYAGAVWCVGFECGVAQAWRCKELMNGSGSAGGRSGREQAHRTV
jgi:hypothetical protein